jgi:CRISPR type III-B/RAMP module RAMP protein Cmr6
MAQLGEQAMDNEKYHLPYQTKEALKEFNPDEACQNLGLLLDKYMPKNIFTGSGKSDWLSNILKPIKGSQAQNNHIDLEFSRNVYQRWYSMLQCSGVEPFHLRVDWRMIVGLGGETVLETDLNLHHLYGIPIIPGSALKGLTRAYVAEAYKEYHVPEDQPEEKRHASKSIDDDHSVIKRIFGHQDVAGTVCFFDAMPLSGQAQFVVDIMNPHYPDYYRSLQSDRITAPSNNQQPNPVSFLTVTNTTFTFALTPRNPHKDQHRGDVALVQKWLQEALQKYGVGGKTSAGYGYFQVAQVYTRPEKLSQFRKGDKIRGIVLDEKTDKVAAKYVGSGQASKCLQYLPFSTDQVLILIHLGFEEAKQWRTRNWQICEFIEEQVEDNRTLLICQPGKKGK